MEATQLAAPTGDRSRIRKVLVALAIVVPALLLVQVYLAGVFLMGGEDTREAHVGIGRMLQFYPLLLLVVGLMAGMPRRFWLAFAVLWIALIAQAWLPLLDASGAAGLVRALHPLNGFLLLGASVQVVRLARPSGDEATRPRTTAER